MAAEALLRPQPVAVGSADVAEAAAAEEADHPLFDRRTRDANGVPMMAGRYSASEQWVLDEHRTLNGNALLPGTGYLELARAALEEQGERGAFELRDLFFFRPLQVPEDEAKEVRVKLKRTDEGYGFEVRGRRVIDGRTGWELHAQAELLLHPLPQARRISPEAIDERCRLERTPEGPAAIASAQEKHLRLGARWRVLRRASFGSSEALAVLELDAQYAADLESFKLHPALLDVATGFAMKLIDGYSPESLWVPVSYRKLRYYAPLTRRLHSWVRSHGDNRADRDVAAFDVTIADEAGQVLVEVEGFAIKRIDGEADFTLAARPLWVPNA